MNSIELKNIPSDVEGTDNEEAEPDSLLMKPKVKVASPQKSKFRRSPPESQKIIGILCLLLILMVLLVILLIFFLAPALNKTSKFKTTTELPQIIETTELPIGKPDEDDKKNCNADFPWKQIRLPANVKPNNYKLKMHPDLETFRFQGTVDISVSIFERTNLIVLHAKEMNITKHELFKIKGSSTESIKSELKNCQKLEEIALVMDNPIDENYEMLIKLEFNGAIRTDMIGLYQNSYTDENDEKKFSAITQFEPTEARLMFPCFDEPAMKATYEISIVRKPEHISLSNMQLISTETISTEALQIDHFNKSVKMSTYLVAISVNEFANITEVSDTKHNVTIAIHAPKHQIKDASFALEVAVKGLKFLEDYFEILFLGFGSIKIAFLNFFPIYHSILDAKSQLIFCIGSLNSDLNYWRCPHHG